MSSPSKSEKNELETNVRIGATNAASWLSRVAKSMADAGKSSQEIAEHLSDLEEVLGDWRDTISAPHLLPHLEIPIDNPWDWSDEELAKYIARRKKAW